MNFRSISGRRSFSLLRRPGHRSFSAAAEVEVPLFDTPRADPSNVAAIILDGGAGTRLSPLTGERAKPAFNSFSLNRHLARTYNFGNAVNFGDGFVEVLAATQIPGEARKKWFQGTADAVRQFLWVFENAKNKNVENVVILSGDHLYQMDYMDFVQRHVDTNADITVSCIPMDDSRASDYELMKIDNTGRIRQFAEKPKGHNLKMMQVDTTLLGLSKQDASKFPYIASMGVYVFKTDVLLKLLKWNYPSCNDFGSEIIPSAVTEHNVQAYLFNDYWEETGTVKSLFDANLALTEQALAEGAMIGYTPKRMQIAQDTLVKMNSRNFFAAAETKAACGGPEFLITGNVCNEEFTFLWDTGSYTCFVDPVVLKSYKRRVGYICAGDGHNVRTLGDCPITWTMGGRRYHHTFTVMDMGVGRFGMGDSGMFPFILGTDFMQRFKVISYHFDKTKRITVIDKQGESYSFTCL